MSLYDETNPQHLAYLDQHRARWTPDKERALQAGFAAKGIGGQYGVRAVGTPELMRLCAEARERGCDGAARAILMELARRTNWVRM